jgi:hypothetical protein
MDLIFFIACTAVFSVTYDIWLEKNYPFIMLDRFYYFISQLLLFTVMSIISVMLNLADSYNLFSFAYSILGSLLMTLLNQSKKEF